MRQSLHRLCFIVQHHQEFFCRFSTMPKKCDEKMVYKLLEKKGLRLNCEE